MSSCLSALCGDARPGLPPVVLEQRSAQDSQAEWAGLLTCRACLTAVDLPLQVLHFRELVQQLCVCVRVCVCVTIQHRHSHTNQRAVKNRGGQGRRLKIP